MQPRIGDAKLPIHRETTELPCQILDSILRTAPVSNHARCGCCCHDVCLDAPDFTTLFMCAGAASVRLTLGRMPMVTVRQMWGFCRDASRGRCRVSFLFFNFTFAFLLLPFFVKKKRNDMTALVLRAGSPLIYRVSVCYVIQPTV